jgi:MFS family permease
MSATSSASGVRAFFPYPAFLRLWVARVLGGSANQIMMVAIGWQMYELTGSAWDLGLVGLYQFAPVLVLTLLAGDAADRFHRGRIIAWCLALQLVACGVLLDANARHWLSRELLLGVSVLLGTARTFQQPAQQSLVPLLVPAALLPRATAFSSAGNQIAVIGGPGLGGLVFAFGVIAVYAVCLAFLVVGLVMTLLVRYRAPETGLHAFSLQSLLAGVRFVFARNVILGAISLDLMAVLFGGATALLPMFVKDILHAGPSALGLLRAAPAVGALVASVVLTHVPLQRAVGRKLMVSVAVYGLCMLVFAWSGSVLLSFAALAVSGCADMVSVVIRQTLVQLDTPDDMRGRVGAVNSIFIGASNQLGEFESGATAAVLGPVGSVVLGGFCTLAVVGIWMKLFPDLLARDRFEDKHPRRPAPIVAGSGAE